jgi:hypothetical protein
MMASAGASIAIYSSDGGGEFRLDVRQNMIKNLRVGNVQSRDGPISSTTEGCEYWARIGHGSRLIEIDSRPIKASDKDFVIAGRWSWIRVTSLVIIVIRMFEYLAHAESRAD